METTMVKIDPGAIIERVIIQGDLSKLTPAERTQYYRRVCESLGLNPLTRPFDYIILNGRLTLYARRDATDQLRKIHGVSIRIVSREKVGEDLYIVLAHATDRTGRTDEAIGAVNIADLTGDALANAIMKAETKAKRRVTLSLVGLGWLDETEIETIPDATPLPADIEVGAEIAVAEPQQQPHWIDDEGTRKRFWAWVGNLGLDREAVHKILGVSSLHEFRGTKQEAARIIQAWVDKQAQPQTEKTLP